MSTAAVQSATPQAFSTVDHFSYSDTQAPSQQAGFHTAVSYVVPPSNGEEVFYRVVPSEGETRSNFVGEDIDVFVNDIRQARETFELHRNGFVMQDLIVPEDLDWNDQEQIRNRYYPLAEEAIKRASGATRVHIFDNTLRNGKVQTGMLQDRGADVRAPVPRVHVDYTVRSGPGRLHQLLPDEADTLKRTPFAVIQVWRPLKGPVDESPLALVDAQTLQPGDLLSNRLELQHRTGYTYSVKHDPGHKFWYAKGMTTSEAFVFKCYDSRKGVARFGPHTAVKDPTTSPDAAPRQSIELRAYAFFEDLPEQPIEHEL